MRLCDRQGTIRCDQGARARRIPQRCHRHGADPQIGDGGRQDMGRREAADGGDQSVEALDTCPGCFASATPRMRCRRSAASASIWRSRMRSRPPTCWLRSSSKGCPTEDELDAVRRRREFPVRMTQAMQVVVQNNIISVALKPGDHPLRAPLLCARGQRGAVAAGHHRALSRARRASRACALAGIPDS